MAAKPYKGNDNYIFISYAHKDIEEVLSFIERLQAEGFNVWFDEGIDPGTEWDENIASHIEGCSFFIAFITENFIKSQNCRDEMSYARDLEKERLLIYGEDVELPRGMQMRLNRLQAIYKHRYANEDEFYSKVFDANAINTCQTADQISAQTAAQTANLTAAQTADKDITVTSKPAISDKRTGNSKGKIIIAIIAVAVLAIGGVIFGLSRNGSGDTIQNEDLKSAKTVTINQIPTEILSGDNLMVTLDNATYTTGASDISFDMTADNTTGDPLYIVLSDVVIDDVPVHVSYDGREDEFKDGDWTFSRDIYLSDIMNAEVVDFKNFSCSMTVLLDGKALQKTVLKLSRDAFSDVNVDLHGSKVDNSNKTIDISKKNMAPTIVLNDKYKIAVNECSYNKGEYVDIILDVKNNSKELMDIYMEDLKVDDSTIAVSHEDSQIQVGENFCELSVYAEDLKAAGVEEFKEMSFTMVVKVGDKESLRQKIHITRDGFVEE